MVNPPEDWEGLVGHELVRMDGFTSDYQIRLRVKTEAETERSEGNHRSLHRYIDLKLEWKNTSRRFLFKTGWGLEGNLRRVKS